MRREDLSDLVALSVIVEQRSFRRAATLLGVSPSALSHAVRRLETRLGTPLLRRTTRSFEAAVGRYKAAIDQGLLDLAGAQDRVIGQVRINVHRTAARLLILPRLAGLRDDYPELTVELTLDDGLTDIVAAGCDAGVRTGELLAADMVAVRISADYHTTLVASPDYLATRAAPAEPENLNGHRCIGYRHVTSRSLVPWRFARGGRQLEVVVEPALVVDDVGIAQRAALDGLGLCYVLREAVLEPLRSGALVEVMADWSVPVAGDFLYYPSRRTLSPSMRVVIDRLRHRD